MKNCKCANWLVLACFGLTAAAAQQAGTGVQDKAVTLAYQFPEGKTLEYRTSGSDTQNLDIQGQAISTRNTVSSEFAFSPKGLKDGNQALVVTMRSLKVDIESPQGNLSPDTSSVTGKSFDMILTRLGKVVDVSGASAIQYDLGMSGKRNVSAGFQAFFPDLPDRPIKIGEIWQSDITINDKSDTSDIRITLKGTNTLDGFETLEGFECARVKTSSKGSMAGSIQQASVVLTVEAAMEGAQTWYFAVKEGIYIRGEERSSFTGTITADQPSMVIPITGQSQSEARLLKK